MRAALRKEQIMDAATTAFSDLGFQKASIAAVCDRAGIARGTLYQYFGDKQALFREVIESYAQRLQNIMRSPTIEEFAQYGAAALLQERLETLFREISENPELYSIFLNEARAANVEARDLVQQINQRLSQQMTATVAFAVQANVADLPDPEFAAEFIVGAVFQIAATYILDAEHPEDPKTLAEKTTELAGRMARL